MIKLLHVCSQKSDVAKKRIVIALGGNALRKWLFKTIRELVKETASCIVDTVEEGYQVIIGHGNGPQVGMIKFSFWSCL